MSVSMDPPLFTTHDCSLFDFMVLNIYNIGVVGFLRYRHRTKVMKCCQMNLLALNHE